jgi:hypothetical protein
MCEIYGLMLKSIWQKELVLYADDLTFLFHEANIRGGGETLTSSVIICPEACCIKGWGWAE